MQYKILNQRHPEYCAEVWSELELLYRGGYDLDEKAKRRLLPPAPGEHLSRYSERIRSSEYVNYFAQVVDYFASALFSKDLHVRSSESTQGAAADNVYEAFAEDATMSGEALSQLLRKVFTKALVKRKAFLCIDFPNPDREPRNQAEAEALGMGRPYAWCLDAECMIDWEVDDDGSFKWCVIHEEYQERQGPQTERVGCIERFKVWERTDDGARWSLYRRVKRSARERVAEGEHVELVATDVTDFRRIPILCLEVPHGLWVGNKVGPLAKEHFQRRSKLAAALTKSLFAIPYVKLGTEIPAAGGPLPAEVQQDPSRGDSLREQLEDRGFIVLGAGDDVGYAEPSGSGYELADQQLSGLVDEMFRVGHQMAMSVANTSKALARSGLSKTEDRHATEIVLQAYGQLVREFAVRVYDTISEARDEPVVWQPMGLDKFEVWDRTQIVDEGTRVRDVDIPSKTFQGLYYGKLAHRLVPDMDPEDATQVRDEIEESLEKEEREADQLLAQMNDTVGSEDEDGAGGGTRGAPEPAPARRRRDGRTDAAGQGSRRAVARSRATS